MFTYFYSGDFFSYPALPVLSLSLFFFFFNVASLSLKYFLLTFKLFQFYLFLRTSHGVWWNIVIYIPNISPPTPAIYLQHDLSQLNDSLDQVTAPSVLGCGAMHWRAGILSVTAFSEKNDFLSSETIQVGAPQKGWGLSITYLICPGIFVVLCGWSHLWVHKGHSYILSRRQNFTAFPHILWLLYSFCLRVPLALW